MIIIEPSPKMARGANATVWPVAVDCSLTGSDWGRCELDQGPVTAISGIPRYRIASTLGCAIVQAVFRQLPTTATKIQPQGHVTERSKARTVFGRSNTEIVGSNPT
jgi:hypothetical protein